jgi:hypothetical protein
MHAVLALAPFVLATTSLAMPAARQVAPGPCANFGSAGFDNANNFTLAAVNTTLPNANTTGAPLVLGSAGAIDGAELEFLSVIFRRFSRIKRETNASRTDLGLLPL